MISKPLIILGSSRKESDTGKIVEHLFLKDEAIVVNLLDFVVCHYSYEGKYPADDNFFLLADMLTKHDKLVFATPVYWYAMSGLIKVFFDRMTDLVTVQKTTGRMLKGKEVFLVAVGADATLPLGFEQPFALTSSYLGMNFKGTCYFDKKEIDAIPPFKVESFRNDIGFTSN